MSDVLFYGRHVMVTREAKCYIAPGDSHDDAFSELAQHIQYLHEDRQSEGNATVKQVVKDIAFKDRIFEIASECDCRAEHGAEGAEHLKAIAGFLRAAIHAHEGSAE